VSGLIISDWPVDADLGDGHLLRYTVAPAETLHPGARLGATIEHPRADGKEGQCWCGVYFDTPEAKAVLAGQRTFWHVESAEPLTISPSVLCLECKDHGFIRGGKWVRA
jgi:hypothetical protein